MNGHRLRDADAGNSSRHYPQITRVAQINLTDAIGRSGTNQIGIFNEFLKGLHPLFALGSRQVVRKSSNNWEMQVFAFWTIENYAVLIDQSEVAAIAYKRDWGALGNVDTDPIRQNALDARGVYPGDLFDFAAPRLKARLAQD